MSDAPPTDQEQSFLSHLIELRQRLVRAALAVVIVFLAMTPFMRQIFDYLSHPLKAALPEGAIPAMAGGSQQLDTKSSG